jgi:hypothetical protein
MLFANKLKGLGGWTASILKELSFAHLLSFVDTARQISPGRIHVKGPLTKLTAFLPAPKQNEKTLWAGPQYTIHSP